MVPYKTQDNADIVHYHMWRDIFIQAQQTKPTQTQMHAATLFWTKKSRVISKPEPT